MANFELIPFANDAELARAAAAAWLDDVEAAKRRGATQYVALSGGRIARILFASVAMLAESRGVSLDAVHFFWTDERCVPPDDVESNFRIAQEFLFAPLKIQSKHIHRIPGEAPPDVAAREASAQIRRTVPEVVVRANYYSSATGAAKSPAPDFQPVLDLIFLGMGEDGHVASLFPGEPEILRLSRAVYRAIENSPKPPPNRVTLGYAAIAAARQVWVLVTGAGKTAALRASLDSSGFTPLARVIQSRSWTRIFSDILLN